MNIPREGNISEYLQKRNHLKHAMNQLKYEVAEEMGYDQFKLPKNGSDTSSREIGLYAGPVGGVIVKELIAQGEKALMDKYGSHK